MLYWQVCESMYGTWFWTAITEDGLQVYHSMIYWNDKEECRADMLKFKADDEGEEPFTRWDGKKVGAIQC